MTTDTSERLTRTGSSATTGSTARTRVTTARGGALVSVVVALTEALEGARDGAVAAGRWLGQTVTAAGWLAITAATAGILVGWVFGWVEWLVAGVASAVLLAMSLPFLFGSRAYDLDVRLAHERVVAGGEVAGEIDIRNRGTRTTLPGRLDLPVGDGLVELGVPLLRAGHMVSQPVTIPTPRRGIIPVGPPTSVRSDPVGLLRREHEWPDVLELYVHPRTVAVPSTSAGLVRDLEGQPTRRLVDADMSFHAIREYVPGDSRRQIHWKSTAKTGRLMVRQFEESRQSRMAIVLSLAEQDYADDDEFELAVGAAASLGVQAVRDGRDLAVFTGVEIPRAVTGRLRSISSITASSPRALLDGFSAIESLEHTMRLEAVCRLTVEASQALSIAFVVCGSAVSVTRLRQAALAFPVDTAVVAIVCDESAHPRIRPFGSLTIMTIGLLDDLASLMLRGVQS